MMSAINVMAFLFPQLTISTFLAEFPLDSLFSTQGIMVMLLAAYAVAMWMFLTSAPKVYTIMVSDLAIAQQLYEGMLELPVAEVPLHYYYNYEQTLGATGIDPLYLSDNYTSLNTTNQVIGVSDGLWYKLMKNTQLHIISGASLGTKNNQRHICFDKDCLEQILMRIQTRGLKYKIRSEKPLNLLVKDWNNRVIEITEVKN
ncbi:MAG: glyoxalase-like domain protein [Trichodesmium sp. MAG_R03]|nr:glyoxalase-like domain protein [Trichodesmium sp. MAG_R03]